MLGLYKKFFGFTVSLMLFRTGLLPADGGEVVPENDYLFYGFCIDSEIEVCVKIIDH